MYSKKIKKGMTAIMLFSLCLSQISIFANPQKPLEQDGIKHIEILNKKGETSDQFAPSVTVEWDKAPTNNAGSEPGSGGPNDTHQAEYYKFELTDFGKKGIAPTLSTPIKNTLIEKVENVMSLRSGAFYKLRVLPAHTHTIRNEDSIVTQEILGTAGGPEKYFLTDFNTSAQDNNGNLEINFEYIPYATYEIVYAEGDFSTAEKILNAFPKKVTLKDDEAKELLYSEDGIDRVRYVIEDVTQGQLYSAFVRVKELNHPDAPSFNKIYQNKNLNELGPKVVRATTHIDLKVFNIGNDKIRLEWKLAPWATLNNALIETVIYARSENSGEYNKIGTINNASMSGADMGFFEYDEPKEQTYYKVEFVLRTKEGEILKIETSEKLYVPFEIRENPINPEIPMFYEKDKVTESNKQDYLVKNDQIEMNHPEFISHTFHVFNESNKKGVQLVWDAPQTKDEKVDYSLTYDIWVSDSQKVLNNKEQEPLLKDVAIKEDMLQKHIISSGKVVGFKQDLFEYINEKGEVKPFESNKTYYIKIVAKKWYGDIPAVSIPTLTQFKFPVTEEIFTPPVMGKPPLVVEDITQTTASLYWGKTWHEIIPKKPSLYEGDAFEVAKHWQSIVYMGSNQEPYIGLMPEESLKEIVLTDQSAIEQVKAIVEEKSKSSTYYDENYSDRKMTLGDVDYEIKLIPYSELDLAGEKIENWIIQNESYSVVGWETIEPKEVQDQKGLTWENYKLENLTPNTRYLVLLRSYKTLENGDKKIQSFPSYALFTTNSDYEAPEETPKVPELQLESVSDTSITVKWPYSDRFDYELVYSRSEDVEKATVVEFELEKPVNGAFTSVEIKGLFPDTTYHIWIRAKQKQGQLVSEWSTPVTATTLMLEDPDVPNGLGLASSQSLIDLGLNIEPKGEDYLILEWNKDLKDIGKVEENHLSLEYIYRIEFASNPEFKDALILEIEDEKIGEEEDTYHVLDKNLVHFKKLQANYPYYARVKTIVKLKDEEENRILKAESDYCKPVKISTQKSDNEYDGGLNDNVVIFDEEIREDYRQDIWEWEVVDTHLFNSKLIQNKDYEYVITMDLYKGEIDASIRRIILPYTVAQTLVNQHMALKVETHLGIYHIPFETLSPYVATLNEKQPLILDFAKMKANEMDLNTYPNLFISGESLKVYGQGKKPLERFNGYIQVQLKEKGLFDPSLLQVKMKNLQDQWIKQGSSIQYGEPLLMSFKTDYPSAYALFQIEPFVANSQTSYGMDRLMKTLNVKGLGTTYKQNTYVKKSEFVQLLLALAEKKNEVDLKAPLTSQQLLKAKQSKLFLSQNTTDVLNQETMIQGIVRLYELKTGYPVSINGQYDVSKVSSVYKESVKKAYSLGLIQSIQPTQKVTYGTLCDLLSQIL